MKKIVFVLLSVAAVLIILPLSFNNADIVTVNYLLDTFDLPLSWVIFGAFIFGVLTALPFFALTGWGWKMRARGLQRQVNELIKQRKRDEIAEQFKAEKQ